MDNPEGGGAVLIAGPTASGKSALAIALAEATGGVVVNADSMQVYADLRLLTARPDAADEGRAPHRLFGFVDGAVNYSVGRYVADAAAALAAIPPGRPAIVVGGTGLYFKALTAGLSEIPAVPDEVRDTVRRQSDGVPTPDLHRRLAERDPETAARLRPTDRLRVQRALEVFAASGRPLVAFHGERRPGPLAGRARANIFLAPDREALGRRIDGRFEAMMTAGALAEVAALAARGLDPMLPVMRAHGVPGLCAHLRGDLSLAGAIAKGKADTRAYAKRQHTFFRHQLSDFAWTQPEAAFDAVMTALSGR